MIWLLVLVCITSATIFIRTQKRTPQKKLGPAPPVDARTLRRHVPAGTKSSDYVIPCPDCGWNEAVSRLWMSQNETFICPQCNSRTRLIKSTAPGAGAIVPEWERLADQLRAAHGPLAEHQAHDEADGPTPAIGTSKRSSKRAGTMALSSTPVRQANKAKKQEAVRVLASALKIPVRLIYDRGHHIGELRDVMILQALGYHGLNGDLDVRMVRCICAKAREFRAFQLAHITELTDMETGEIVVDVPTWLERKLANLV
jgi:hypothetical protein